MRYIITTIVALFAISSGMTQHHDLKLNLQQGEEYKQTVFSNTVIVQDLMGTEMEINMEISGSMLFKVKEVVDENFELIASYKFLGMKMNTPQGTTEFNSDSQDEGDVFSKMFREIIDKEFQLTMSSKGKVLEVSGITEMWEGTIDQFTDIPDATRQGIKDNLMQSYGEDAFKGNIEMGTSIFPEKPVGLNEKWEVVTYLNSGMEATITTEYTLMDETEEFFIIKGEGLMKTNDEADFVMNNGLPMKYNLEGPMSSELKINKNSGWVVEAKINQFFEGEAEVDDSPQVPGGMKIPMAMKSEMTISN